MFDKKKILKFLIAGLCLFCLKSGLAQSLNPTLKLTNINGYSVPMQNNIPYPDFQKQGSRDIINLNTEWIKERQDVDPNKSIAKRDSAGIKAITNEGGGRHRIVYSDSNWQTISVPKVENNMCAYEDSSGPESYEDGVWYRKKFTINSNWQDKKYITLIFLGVNYIADVWLNENYLGYHEGGYTSFAFNITEALNYPGTNVLAVRVDNIPWASSTALDNARIPYTVCDWFNYTGILRDVYIAAQNKIHTVRQDIKTLNNSGNIDVNMIFQNYKTKDILTSSKLEIFKADFSGANIKKIVMDESILFGSAVVQKDFSFTIKSNEINHHKENLTIPSPEYWLPASPSLYIARITLYTNGVVVDRTYSQFGLRTLKIIDNRIQANENTSPFLAGTARHEDHPDVGAAVSTDSIYYDLEIIKNSLNCTFLRTGHYPNHPITYKYTDRLGLVTYCEIPVYWFDGSHYDKQRNERKIAKQMWREMIYSHYNSPSIWFWGTLNEGSHQSERQNFIQDLYDDAYEIDGSRFVLQAATGSDVSDSTHNACDVVGVNMYYGIFYTNEGRGNYYYPTKNALQELHSNFPDKPILVTEYGYWSSIDDSSASEQEQVFVDTFKAFKEAAVRKDNGALNSDGFLIGCVWWTAFNWYSPFSKVQSMGLIHMNRTTFKPAADRLADEYKNYISILPDDISRQNLNNVIAYPNPWIEGRSSVNYIIFKNLTKKSTVKIYDVSESLVKELKQDEECGYLIWDIDDFSGKRVEPGVYIYYVLDENRNLGKGGKILIIR